MAILASFLTVRVEVFAASCLVCTHLSAFQLQALIPDNIRVDDLDFHVLLLQPIMNKIDIIGVWVYELKIIWYIIYHH